MRLKLIYWGGMSSYDDNYFGKEDNWVLVIVRSATEDDLVENHYLEEVGEDIWCTAVEISHCPYCGIYLGEIRGDAANTVKIAHFDYRSWNSRRS